MDAAELIARNDLEEAYVSVRLADCLLTFHRQRRTRDIWCITAGPLATFASTVARQEMLDHVRSRENQYPVGRKPAKGSVHVTLDEDFAIDLRARGQEVHGTYLYEGRPFGGFGGGFPSGRKLSFAQRVADRLRGRRGSAIEIAYHRE